MTMFDDMLAAADVTVDAVYAETFAFQPMREVVNGDPVADESRPALAAFAAVFDEPGILAAAGRDAVRHVSAGPALSLRDGEGPATIRRLDRFVRARTGTVYEVTAVVPDDFGRRVVTLVERMA